MPATVVPKFETIEDLTKWVNLTKYNELCLIANKERENLSNILVANLDDAQFLQLITGLSLRCFEQKGTEFISKDADDFLASLLNAYLKKHDVTTIARFKLILKDTNTNEPDTNTNKSKNTIDLTQLILSKNTQDIFSKIKEVSEEMVKSNNNQQYVTELPRYIFNRLIAPRLYYFYGTAEVTGRPKWLTLGITDPQKDETLSHLEALFRDYHVKAHWYFVHSFRTHSKEARELEGFINKTKSSLTAIQDVYLKLIETYEDAKIKHSNDPKSWNLTGSYMRRLEYALKVCETKLAFDPMPIATKAQKLATDTDMLKRWFDANLPKPTQEDNISASM